MRISKARAATLLIGAAFLSRLVACSPSVGGGGLGGPAGNAGGQLGLGGNGTGNTGSGAGGDTFMGFDTGGSGPTDASGVGGGCPELTQKPEEIITYRDATVTDTIVTYSPVAIYIMQDRSTSMNTGLAGGSPQSWGYSTDALQAFVNDPASKGIDMGLAVFPPMSTGQGLCDGSDCGQPMVPIGPLPGNGAAIMSAMQQATPTLLPLLFTPTECALRGMINHCIDYQKQSNGEKCYAVLITDGTPTSCDTNNANLVKIVSDGKAAGVTTFTLGLTGSDLNFLNQLAQAGGSTKAIDVSGGSAAFIAALNGIRDKVSITDRHQISIPTTIATPLPCEWTIPAPSDGTTFQKDKVNVKFTPKGQPAQDFGYVAQADCARLNGGGGWYYDDPNSPTKVLLCPTTCATVEASSGAEVDLAFGCEQKKAVLH